METNNRFELLSSLVTENPLEAKIAPKKQSPRVEPVLKLNQVNTFLTKQRPDTLDDRCPEYRFARHYVNDGSLIPCYAVACLVAEVTPDFQHINFLIGRYVDLYFHTYRLPPRFQEIAKERLTRYHVAMIMETRRLLALERHVVVGEHSWNFGVFRLAYPAKLRATTVDVQAPVVPDTTHEVGKLFPKPVSQRYRANRQAAKTWRRQHPRAESPSRPILPGEDGFQVPTPVVMPSIKRECWSHPSLRPRTKDEDDYIVFDDGTSEYGNAECLTGNKLYDLFSSNPTGVNCTYFRRIYDISQLGWCHYTTPNFYNITTARPASWDLQQHFWFGDNYSNPLLAQFCKTIPEQPLLCDDSCQNGIFCEHYAAACPDITYNISCQCPTELEVLQADKAGKFDFDPIGKIPTRDGRFYNEHASCPQLIRSSCPCSIEVPWEISVNNHGSKHYTYSCYLPLTCRWHAEQSGNHYVVDRLQSYHHQFRQKDLLEADLQDTRQHLMESMDRSFDRTTEMWDHQWGKRLVAEVVRLWEGCQPQMLGATAAYQQAKEFVGNVSTIAEAATSVNNFMSYIMPILTKTKDIVLEIWPKLLLLLLSIALLIVFSIFLHYCSGKTAKVLAGILVAMLSLGTIYGVATTFVTLCSTRVQNIMQGLVNDNCDSLADEIEMDYDIARFAMLPPDFDVANYKETTRLAKMAREVKPFDEPTNFSHVWLQMSALSLEINALPCHPNLPELPVRATPTDYLTWCNRCMLLCRVAYPDYYARFDRLSTLAFRFTNIKDEFDSVADEFYDTNMPVMMGDAHASHIWTDFLDFIGEMFDFSHKARLFVQVHSLVVFTRDIGSVFRWLFEIVPLTIQGWCFTQCPAIMDAILYQHSEWKSYKLQMERFLTELKEPTADLIKDAEALLNKIKNYLSLKCGEGWATHAEAEMLKFKHEISDAKARYQGMIKGQNPHFFYFVGLPGIGKTTLTRGIADLLASIHLGRVTRTSVYERPSGQYMDAHGDAPVLLYPELFGTTSETNLAQVEEVMSFANANFKPNCAAVDKKDLLWSLYAVVGSSNVIYPHDFQGFSNTAALWRRRDLVILAEWNERYPFLVRKADGSIDQIATIDNLRKDPEACRYPHMCFKLIHPVPVNPASYITYNNYEKLGETVDNRWTDYLKSRNAVNGALSYPQLLDFIVHYCRQSSAQKSAVREGTAQFVDNYINQVLGITPVVTEIPIYMKDTNCADLLPPAQRTWYNTALIALGVSAGAAVLVSALIALVHFLKERKQEEKVGDAEYGGRLRTIGTARTRAKLRAAAKTGEAQFLPNPVHEFLERCDLHQVMIKTPYGSNAGFLIDQSHILTVRHVFMDPKSEKLDINVPCEITFYREGVEDTEFINVSNSLITPLYTRFHDKQKHLVQDKIVITLENPISGVRSIRNMFISNEELLTLPTLTVHRIGNGHESSGKIYRGIEAVLYNQFKTLSAFDGFLYTAYSQPGDCGSVIWAEVKGTPKFLGIHVAGLPADQGMGAFVTKECLKNVLPSTVTQLGMAESVEAGFVGQIDTLDTENVKVPEGFIPLGKTSRAVTCINNTQLKKSPFWNCSIDYPCRVAPSVKTPESRYEQEKKYAIKRKPIPQHLLLFSEKVSDLHYPAPKNPLRQYTIDEACSIIPVDASVGWNWDMSRKDLLIQQADGSYKAHEKLRVRVQALLDYVNEHGTVPLVVITPYLKDETLALEKIAVGKIRTFQISQLECLVFGVMVLGDYLMYMHSNPITRPSTVGIDPASVEWSKIFSPLMDENEWKLVDLDYKAMEATITWQLFYSFHRHTTRYYQDYESPTALLRLAYLRMMCYSVMVIDKNAYLRDHGNPSGMYGTTDVNTYCAGVFTFYSLKCCVPDINITDVKSVLMCKFNGDDTVLAVAPIIQEQFNFFTVRDALAKLNVEITPAKKNEEPTPFVEQTQITFCKKFILWSDELHAYVPFVKFHTLLDQLSWARDVTDKGLVQIVNSALAWSFFRGRSVVNGQIPEDEPTFDEQRDLFVSMIPEMNEHIFDYDVFLDRYNHPRCLEQAAPVTDLFNCMRIF